MAKDANGEGGGFFVYTPKGKPVKLKKLGITLTNKLKNGKPGVVVTEEPKK